MMAQAYSPRHLWQKAEKDGSPGQGQPDLLSKTKAQKNKRYINK
jgi:hypothetical protein